MSKKFSKYVSVHIDEEIETRITLSINEIKDFISDLDKDEKNEILSILNEVNIPEGIDIKTLDDVFRFKILSEAFEKYNIFELEERLK